MTNIRTAIRTAARHVSMPWGRGTSWRFQCPWYEIGGPWTEINADSYSRALARRRGVVAWTAVQVLGGDPVQCMTAQYYADQGDAVAAAVKKAMEEE